MGNMTEKRGQNVGKNIVEKWGNRKKTGVTRGKEGTKGRKGGQRESKSGVKWGAK